MLQNICCFIKRSLPLIVFFAYTTCLAQRDSNTVVSFDFNDHTFNESQGRAKPVPFDATLGEDRFGNKQSALYLQGHTNSYFILGTEDILKPHQGSISLWVKLERKVYAGKGYESNPFLVTRISPEVDFYDAYSLHYDFKSDRLMVFFSKDSTEQSGVNAIEPFIFNEWQHIVFTYDNHHVQLYLNGEKQGEAKKDFETTFLKNSPLYISHCASTKNVRRMRGLVDDIKIFHRVISEKEVKDLYHAPNPNRVMNMLYTILKWLGFLAFAVLLAFLLVWQRRRALMRAKEKLDLNRKIHEMEIRTLKAQMNPHFIFNSLNSIQQFIVNNHNDHAEHYLSKFSRLIRKLLESNTNESLSISEEMDILNGYIEIESLRFSHSFNYSVTADERVDITARIPHMMIQPFVENAIWHGLLPSQHNRHLDIRFYYETARSVRCVVTDNGVGINAIIKPQHDPEKRSMGLSLVKQRMELIRQSLNVACSFEIRPGVNQVGQQEGTTVIIIIPFIDK